MKSNKSLRGKVVVITGGSSGLGEQIAYQAVERGATVVVCARRKPLLEKVSAKCEALSGRSSYYFELDVSDPDSVEEIYEDILMTVGKVDILVNCAGFGYFENFLDFDLSLAEKMFSVNVLGLMYLTQKVGLHMAERKQGHIINIASQAGKIASPKSTVYSATKFAVLGFSNALRLELKPFGVTVTTVNPGPIETDFFSIADQSGDYLSKVNWIALDPSKLAKQIVASFGTSCREINAPKMMDFASKVYVLFPHLGDWIAGNVFNTK